MHYSIYVSLKMYVVFMLNSIWYCVYADVHCNELLQGWQAHLGQVLQVQYSVDETSIFSVGEDRIVSH